MKRLLILSRDLKHKGGVVNFIYLLIQNLSEEKFNVKHFIEGRSPSLWRIIFLPFIILWQLILFKKVLKNFNADIVHLNPSFNVRALLRDFFYLIIINKYYSGKTLIMFHGWNNVLAKRIINNSFYNNLFHRVYGKADLMLTLCTRYREQLIKIGIPPEKVKTTTTMYQSIQNINKYHAKKINNKVKILFMSRFVKSKGIYIAADVARLLVEKGCKNFSFIFAGDGPEYKKLKKYTDKYGLQNFIEIPGYMRGDKKGQILENSDIFLFPTYYGEGCPVAILEAMGAGLVVVSTPVAAIPEIVEHNENGFIINSKDPRDFYRVVKRLIEDKELLNKIQKSNREKAEKKYVAKVVTEKIESIYLSIN